MNENMRVWVNGALVDPDGPSVSALDHGVTVGDGVFETVKIIDGEPFALTRHQRRLLRSARGLGLPEPDLEVVNQGIAAVLDGSVITHGRLRFSVTGGVGPLGSDRQGSALTYIVLAAPAARPPASAKVTIVPFTRNERSATAGLKTTSYAENVVALARAQEVGAVEAVFANTRGELCECTGSNIFVVIDGVVHTPPLEGGALGGITRELTIEWAQADGVRVEQSALPVDVLMHADEVFITSTTKDVLPVHAVDDRELPAPGPVTLRVQQVFKTAAGKGLDP